MYRRATNCPSLLFPYSYISHPKRSSQAEGKKHMAFVEPNWIGMVVMLSEVRDLNLQCLVMKCY